MFNPEEPEFLIREKDDFSIKKVSSLEAASFFRPARTSSDSFEIKETAERGGTVYFIKNLLNGKIISLSQKGFELWNLMDGKTSLRSLAAGYFLKYGAFDFNEIRTLILQLRSNDLIEGQSSRFLFLQRFFRRFKHPALIRILKWVEAWSSFDIKIQNVDALMSSVYQKAGRFFFNRIFGVPAFVISAWATFLFVRSLFSLRYTPASFLDSPLKWLAAYLIFIPVIPIHELAHALTTKHFGYRVRDFGFTLLHHILPVFYADVTDIWMAPPRERMWVALAGPYSGWLLGSAAVLLSYLFPGHEFIFYLFAFNCYAGVLVNLYPFLFLEMDGYYVLIDLLKTPHLRKEAFHSVKSLFKGSECLCIRKSIFALIYAVISVFSVCMIFAYILWSFCYGK